MLRCDNLHRQFHGPRGPVHALQGLDLSIPSGEFVVIRGASGSGKSTLLLALGGMQHPSLGRVLFHDRDLYALPAPQRNLLRAQSIGFVFQLFHLLPYLTVHDNIRVGLPPQMRDAPGSNAIPNLLERLGLQHRADHLPAGLSAGERQRVALARALIKQPDVILADEPTGNLDPDNAAEVFRQLNAYRQSGGTVVVVTHGSNADPYATKTLTLSQGKLTPPTANNNPSLP
jgi:ABC-type lipoprotein export system ATPase subunit